MRFGGKHVFPAHRARQIIGRAKRWTLYRLSFEFLRLSLALYRWGLATDARLVMTVSHRLRRLAAGR